MLVKANTRQLGGFFYCQNMKEADRRPITESRVDKNNVTNRYGLKGSWTDARNGFGNQIIIESAADLIKHNMTHITSYAVGQTFGEKAEREFREWKGE